MRRQTIFTVLLLFCPTVFCLAQETALKKKYIADIRTAYAEAKAQMGHANGEESPRNDTEIVGMYIYPGTGPTRDVTHYYYTGDWDEDCSNYIYTPYFISRSYNVAATKYYEEFLYNQQESLIFYYQKSGDREVRFYWGPNGFFHDDIKGEPLTDMVSACRLSEDLIEAFNHLMNR